jgi:hypothetical protein
MRKDTEMCVVACGRVKMRYPCFAHTPVFTVSLVFGKSERSCASHFSYPSYSTSAQAPSEPSHSTVHRYAINFPTLTVVMWPIAAGLEPLGKGPLNSGLSEVDRA